MRCNFDSQINASNASAFVSIGNGKYYFFKGSIFSKKAYIVNSKEKNELESFLQNSMYKLAVVVSLLTAISFYDLSLSLIGIVLFGMFALYKYKTLINKIISYKDLVIVKERSLISIITKQANSYSYKNILSGILLSPFLIIIPFFTGREQIAESFYFKCFMILGALFMFLVVCLNICYLYIRIINHFRIKKLGK